ncbi:putative transcription factor interactor and regulator AUX-IAA family [Helianthus annuus]|nr:putative transcription factor interactor and regulator AUX-IAA family [Helianthus annuus]
MTPLAVSIIRYPSLCVYKYKHYPHKTKHTSSSKIIIITKKMGPQVIGLEITELRLGLPGGGDSGERRVKKRVISEGGQEVDVVVGWPPVGLYRKNVVAKLYVKVSMDGVPILRKVDISCFKGYSELGMGLEKLFDCYGIGQAMEEDNGSCEYTTIYEDKDGDWMLVGDVPWL